MVQFAAQFQDLLLISFLLTKLKLLNLFGFLVFHCRPPSSWFRTQPSHSLSLEDLRPDSHLRGIDPEMSSRRYHTRTTGLVIVYHGQLLFQRIKCLRMLSLKRFKSMDLGLLNLLSDWFRWRDTVFSAKAFIGEPSRKILLYNLCLELTWIFSHKNAPQSLEYLSNNYGALHFLVMRFFVCAGDP